jgi:hypothetical protein
MYFYRLCDRLESLDRYGMSTDPVSQYRLRNSCPVRNNGISNLEGQSPKDIHLPGLEQAVAKL